MKKRIVVVVAVDYVSSCGIPLMPVVYQVVGFGRSYTAATRIVTGGV